MRSVWVLQARKACGVRLAWFWLDRAGAVKCFVFPQFQSEEKSELRLLSKAV